LTTHHEKILIAETNVRENMNDKINKLISLIDGQKNQKLVLILKEIIPEYVSQNSEFEELDKA
jgi:hypothetical protein